jgi:hypothetical protein
VPQRENAIINRLNKTKVERHPDLREEKENHLKELRKKDQAAMLARVSLFPLIIIHENAKSVTEEGRSSD